MVMGKEKELSKGKGEWSGIQKHRLEGQCSWPRHREK